jgi:hypothetical protein
MMLEIKDQPEGERSGMSEPAFEERLSRAVDLVEILKRLRRVGAAGRGTTAADRGEDERIAALEAALAANAVKIQNLRAALEDPPVGSSNTVFTGLPDALAASVKEKP